MKDIADRIRKLSPKQLLLLALDQQERLEAVERKRREPIAVIGMGCRFPGGADSPLKFWQLLDGGQDAIREVPRDRWNVDAMYDPDPDAPARISVRTGGFLDAIGGFDAPFFGIAPREAMSMDPQQRLLLEVGWQALEHAGLAADQLAGTATGVFVGVCNSDHFLRMLHRGAENIDAYLASGNAPSVTAGRIAYCLGLQGPAIAVDTACSSSLIAIHLACRSLRDGESRLALACGVNVICSPETSIALSKAHMLAPDGRCKTFDAKADGFARGEGCGVLVLKRLSDATADGDNILAVIRGSAVNQDGRSSGLTVPNGPAQEAVIRAALVDAGVEPSEIDYVEAHGTGTSLGDPIEVRALSRALASDKKREEPLLIGSVKTNVGHLESAAGIAGVIKVILALQHGRIPPHLHFDQPTPHIPWSDYRLKVTGRGQEWPCGNGRRLAGVSSFGFSGTNAHAVIQEAPRADRKFLSAEPRSFHCLPLSARSETALATLARRYADIVSNRPDVALEDVVHTAGTGRSHLPNRLAVVADTRAAAAEALYAFADGGSHPALHSGTATPGQPQDIVFVFSGHGAAVAGIGRQCYEASAVYRDTIDRCDQIIGPDLSGRTLKSFFRQPPPDEPYWAGLILFAMQYAAVQLWKSLGVEPASVIGDGDGEYAAACAAGVFSLEDALRVVAERGRLLQSGDPSLDAWASAVPRQTPAIPVAWTGSGADRPAMDAAPDARYWVHHPSDARGFADAIARLTQAGYRHFLQLLPTPAVIDQALPDGGTIHRKSLADCRDAWNWIARGLAELYVRGGPIDWHEVTKGARKCELPTYPFEHRDYWYSPAQLDDLSGTDAAGRLEPKPARTFSNPQDTDLFYEVVWKELPLPVRAAPWLTSPDRFASAMHERFAALAQQHGLSIYDRLLPELDRLSAAYLAKALRQLGFDTTVGRWIAIDQEAAQLGIAQRHLRLFKRLLESLVDDGIARRRGTALEITGLLPAVDPGPLMQAAMAEFGEVDGELSILQRCGNQLARVLTGDQDPLELLFPGGSLNQARRLYVESPVARTFNLALIEALNTAIEALPPDATLRVLEIGGGTGGTTSYVLPRLPSARVEYVFTDVSQLFLGRITEQFAAYDGLRTALLDIETDPFAQGFRPGQFDVVIATNVLHATLDLRQTVAHVRSLLAPEGMLCLLEAVQPQRWADCTFGLTEGWWRFADDGIRSDYPLITWDAWRDLLTTGGFTSVTAIPGEAAESRSQSQQGLIVARAASGGHRWTLVGDIDGVGAELAQRLLARGDIVVSCESNAGEAIAAAEGSLVYLGALELADLPNDDPSMLAPCKDIACALPLHWLARAAAGSARAWLVTRGTQQATGRLSGGARWQAPLWGIGRTFALEHPNRLAGLVDLPAMGSNQEWADTLLATFDASDSEDQMVWRDGVRLVPRLEHTAAPDRQAMAFRPDATYLVTGGFGRIGLGIARWMAELGARHIALVGRHPDTSSDAIYSIEQLGARVIPFAADVADEAAMTTVFDRLRAEAPQVRGVMHAAAEFSAFSITAVTRADVEGTLRSKMDGMIVLERLTQAFELDFFVLFSSAASVLGIANYAHYAAANSFLDATAETARNQGRRVTVANWGAWEAGADKNREFRDGGLVPMPEAVALDALGQLMFSNAPPRTVGRFDWSVLRPLLEARHPRPIVADLAAVSPDKAPVRSAATSDDLLERLARTPADMRPGLLEDFVRDQVAAVLGHAGDATIPPETGFFDLGMDSLTAVELRRRLERGCGLSLPSSLTFSYPNLRTLSDFLAHRLGEPAETNESIQAPIPLTAIPPTAPLAVPPHVAATAIDDLTDSELAARLLARLKEVQ